MSELNIVPRTLVIKFDESIIKDTNESIGKLISFLSLVKGVRSVSRYIDSSEETCVNEYHTGKLTSYLFEKMNSLDNDEEAVKIYEFINQINSFIKFEGEFGLTIQLEKDFKKGNIKFLKEGIQMIVGVKEIEEFYYTEKEKEYSEKILQKLNKEICEFCF